MFRLKDLMQFWANDKGITMKQILEAVKAPRRDWSDRFTVCKRHKHTMIKVHSAPPIGQAEAKA